MRNHHGTRSTSVRPQFEVLEVRGGTPRLPLHVHVRQWAHDGAVASLLVYAPTRGGWFEGDDMPLDVRAFALDALARRLNRLLVFADATGVRL